MAERLPCGCIVDMVGEAFVMDPCDPDCEYYRYALEESKRQGKSVEALVDPDVSDEEKVARLLREHGLGGR